MMYVLTGFCRYRAPCGCQANSFIESRIRSCTLQVSYFTFTSQLALMFISPGVHWLQDPRSRVYNFTPWIENIPDVKSFAFERVTGFVRSSQDNVCLSSIIQEQPTQNI